MKMQITKDDMPKIIGKFIIELLEDRESNKTIEGLSNSELEYYIEKRIKLVSTFSGDDGKNIIKSSLIDGYAFAPMTIEIFVERFNKPSTEGRFCRLLYSNEIDRMAKWMKEKNY